MNEIYMLRIPCGQIPETKIPREACKKVLMMAIKLYFSPSLKSHLLTLLFCKGVEFFSDYSKVTSWKFFNSFLHLFFWISVSYKLLFLFRGREKVTPTRNMECKQGSRAIFILCVRVVNIGCGQIEKKYIKGMLQERNWKSNLIRG